MKSPETLSRWYIVRTKQYKERFVKEQASRFVDDVYLPLLRKRTHYSKKLALRVEPLFPCYLFIYFSLAVSYYRLRYTEGVTDIVCLGNEPCEVDHSIILKLKSRETHGVVEVVNPKLQPRQRVNILRPPFL